MYTNSLYCILATRWTLKTKIANGLFKMFNVMQLKFQNKLNFIF